MDEPGLLHEPLALTSHLSFQQGVLLHITQACRLVQAGNQECGSDMSGAGGGRDGGRLSTPWMAPHGKHCSSVNPLEDSRPNLIHYGLHGVSRPTRWDITVGAKTSSRWLEMNSLSFILSLPSINLIIASSFSVQMSNIFCFELLSSEQVINTVCMQCIYKCEVNLLHLFQFFHVKFSCPSFHSEICYFTHC